MASLPTGRLRSSMTGSSWEAKNVTYIGPAGIAFANKQLTRDVDLFTVRVNYKFGSQEVARF